MIKMVEAGSLEMTATLDTTDVERGNRRVTQGLNNVQSETLATNSTFNKMSGTVGTLSKALAGVATAGLGSLTAIGLKSPVVADELANIKVSAFELSNTVGKELEPALNNVDTLIQTLNEGLQGGGGSIFGAVAETITTFPLAILKDINNAVESFQSLTGTDKESGDSEDKMSLSEGFDETIRQQKEQGFFGSIIQDAKDIGEIGKNKFEDTFGFSVPTVNPIAPGGQALSSLYNIISGSNNESDRKQTALNTAD